MQKPISLLLASFLGISAVVLGAMGAHALKGTLIERGAVAAWQTAVLYHLVHAVACLAVSLTETALYPAPVFRKWLLRAALCWTAGSLLFSGSLYWLALGGPRWLGPVTPLGGVLLIAGWIAIALAAKDSRAARQSLGAADDGHP